MRNRIYINLDNESDFINKVSGTIIATSMLVDNQEFLSVEWQGGDTVAISLEYIQEVFNSHNFMTNGRMRTGLRCRKRRNYLTIGPFKLRIIHYYKRTHTYLAKRIPES